jgi:hypothetical protein
MLCQYCKGTCSRLHRERKRRWWWQCDKCSVAYLTSLKGNIEVITFKTKAVDNVYAITLYLKTKTSSILLWKNVAPPNEKPRYSIDSEIKEFDKLLDNITPDNFQDRLKTYLIFL